MNIILEKANRLIWQNRSRTGGTKLLCRAREIEASPKIQRIEESPRGTPKRWLRGPMENCMKLGCLHLVKCIVRVHSLLI